MENNTLQVMKLSEIFASDLKSPEWLIKDFIYLGSVTLISGRYGSYKSWLSQYIAACISAGRKVFGEYETMEGKILCIDKENSLQLIKSRYKLLNANPENILFLSDETDLSYSQVNENIQKIINFVKESKILMVINDSFIRFIGRADENSASDMSKITQTIRKFCSENTTVLTLDHIRKGVIGEGKKGDMLRGSSEKAANVDQHFMIDVVDEDEKILRIYNEKNRFNDRLEPFYIRFDIDETKAEFVMCEYKEKRSARPAMEEAVREAVIEILASATGNEMKQSELIKLLVDKNIYKKRKIIDLLQIFCINGTLEQFNKPDDNRETWYVLI